MTNNSIDNKSKEEQSSDEQKVIEEIIRKISKREFYRGISTGKIVIANMVKTKLQNIIDNFDDKDDDILIQKLSDIVKFCNITTTTTPEIEENITESFK